MKESILVLNPHAPYGTAHAAETLDFIFAAGAIFNKVSVLFYGDGIFQLLKNQNTTTLQMSALGPQLASLPFYDVTSIYVQANDLTMRGLQMADLILPVTLITDADIKQLVTEYECVLKL